MTAVKSRPLSRHSDLPARSCRARSPRRPGMTLVELMVALAILTIGVVSLMGTFGMIQKGVQSAKNRTLASNLAQEMMQILKQKTYYQVLTTTSPVNNSTDFYPEVVSYDTGYFPPEDITEAGVVYTRYVFVQSIREDSGEIGEVPVNMPDTGMKRITVHVVWGQGDGKRKVTMRSILSNPDTVMSNAVFRGVVRSTAPEALPGAMVSLVEAEGYADTADSSGQYFINATPGSYTLKVSATGYYTALLPRTVEAGGTQVNDVTLNRVSVGSIRGYPWINDHLVISQVVGSTCTVPICSMGYDQEYVEVFNPTTYTWTMDGEIGLRFQRSADGVKKNILVNYLNSDIRAGGYYLFANTGTVIVAGSNVDVDAVWGTGNNTTDFPYFASDMNIIPTAAAVSDAEGAGAVELYRIADGEPLDRVGWDKNGHAAPFYEGS
ncbi:MAG TPA: carboxypeptidase regulatory-like domain-containing protein, partial [Elusimicrobiales bacterium]|nr:carboxypeptidase regulatory-like domain-containing protein [Elusimicrobiales bacterium]